MVPGRLRSFGNRDGALNRPCPVFESPVPAKIGRAGHVLGRGNVRARQHRQRIDKRLSTRPASNFAAIDENIAVPRERAADLRQHGGEPADIVVGIRRIAEAKLRDIAMRDNLDAGDVAIAAHRIGNLLQSVAVGIELDDNRARRNARDQGRLVRNPRIDEHDDRVAGRPVAYAGRLLPLACLLIPFRSLQYDAFACALLARHRRRIALHLESFVALARRERQGAIHARRRGRADRRALACLLGQRRRRSFLMGIGRRRLAFVATGIVRPAATPVGAGGQSVRLACGLRGSPGDGGNRPRLGGRLPLRDHVRGSAVEDHARLEQPIVERGAERRGALGLAR